MLKENESLKKDIFDTVTEMSVKLNKSRLKRNELLKKNIEDYDLEQRRREFKT